MQKIDQDEFIKLYQELSVYELARQLKISPPTVYNWAKKLGLAIKRTPQGTKLKKENKN